MSRHCRYSNSALASAIGLVSTFVWAEPAAPLDLTWQAPSECPGASWVQNEVERLVGPGRRKVRVQGVVTQDAAKGRFLVRIELSGEIEGVRTLSATSCASAARAAALIMALSIDPQAASLLSGQREPSPEASEPARAVQQRKGPAPNSGTPAAKQPAAEASASDTRDATAAPSGMRAKHEDARMHGLVFAGLSGEQASVPQFGIGAGLGGGVELGRVRADVAVSAVPSVHGRVDGDPERGASFTLGLVAARVCPELANGALGVFACGAVRATRIWTKGTGVPESFSRHTDLLAMGVGGLLRWPGHSPWAAELGVELDVPLNRPEFVVENAGPVYRPHAVGGSGMLAVGWRF